ncbi:MAG: SRPBCC family protein [Actinobacteria bacterium]|nr:SRPBCC family protein [Actinomycetota bacterium]
MADSVSERTTIEAPAADVLAVLLDFERYPEWARDLKEAEVLVRDAEGRPLEVRFRAAGMGHSTSYTLRYDHSRPDRLAWRLVEGDVARKLDGQYTFHELDGGGRTDITYDLEAELKMPLPRFVKRRTQLKISHTALRELKARVEAGHR